MKNRFNSYFIIYTFFFIFHVIASSINLDKILYPDEYWTHRINPFVLVVLVIIIGWFGIKIVLEIMNQQKKIIYFKYSFILLYIALVLSSSSIIFGAPVYKKIFHLPVVITGGLCLLLTTFFLIKVLMKVEKKNKGDATLVLLAFLMGQFDIVFDRIVPGYGIPGFPRASFLFVTLSMLIFLYIFAKKYSDIFKELQDYSDKLEEKVKDRTTVIEHLQEKESNFYIRLVHETRHPLQIILDLSSDLYRRLKSDNLKNIAKQICTQVNILIEKSNDIIDSNKMSAGKAIYNHTTIFNLHEMMLIKSSLYEEYARIKKNLDLVYVPENERAYIKADPKAIGKILDNLIVNAINYSKNVGEIRLELHKKRDFWNIHVIDRGQGVHEEDKKIIFEKFDRGTHSSINIKGSGLGLFICKQITGELGGTIEVQDNKPKGSIFIVTLPEYTLQENDTIMPLKDITVVYEAEVQEIKEIKQEFDVEKPIILIVEDHDVLRNHLTEKLIDKYNIFTACNGEEALGILSRKQTPDLIVSDIMMPIMDGIEFFKNTHKRLPHVPFLFLSAKSDIEESVKTIQQGAIHFIQKPFNLDMFSAKIDSLISLKENLIRNIKEPQNFIDDQEIEKVILNKNDLFKFVDKDLKIIKMTMCGSTDKEICETLNMDQKTLNVHYSTIRKKIVEKVKIDERYETGTRDTVKINKKNLFFTFELA